MTDIASIRRKIVALLAKAKSTTSPAEAMAFAAKAQELLAKHNLTEADVDPERPGRTHHSRIVTWQGTVAKAAAHLFDVHIYRNSADGAAVFVGPEGNRVTATLMHDFFLASIRRAKRQWQKDLRAKLLDTHEALGRDRLSTSVQASVEGQIKSAGRRAAFERGMAGELYRRAKEAHTQSQDALDKAALALPELEQRKGRRVRVGEGYGAGREAAAGVGLNRQAVGGRALQLGGF